MYSTVAISVVWAVTSSVPVEPEHTRESVANAIRLIELSAAEYRDQRSCFACHHQTLPVVALAEARDAGFPIDADNFKAQLDRTDEHIRGGIDRYREGKGQGGGVDTASFALWALAAGSREPNEATEAVVGYLVGRDRKRDHWRGTDFRPPTQASELTRSASILRGIDHFGTAEQKAAFAGRREKVIAKIQTAEPGDTEDRVFQLLAMAHVNAPEGVRKAAAEALIGEQHADGGWGQKPGMPSDAYATGSALTALRKSGCVPADTPAYRRGVWYLLRTQHEDGSWHVQTRSRPIQTYFESGFPHGKDQFISTYATCWAVRALLPAVHPQPDEDGE